VPDLPGKAVSKDDCRIQEKLGVICRRDQRTRSIEIDLYAQTAKHAGARWVFRAPQSAWRAPDQA